jgi:integrase
METDHGLRWGSNRVLLNRQKLDSIKAREGELRTEWWDESLLGFGVRVYLNGKKILTVRYTLRGKRHRKDIGVYRNGPGETGTEIGYTEGRQQAADILGKVRDGVDPFSSATRLRDAGLGNFGSICVRFVEDRLPELSPVTAKEFERVIKTEIVPEWGSRSPEDIQPEEVEDWAQKIAKGVGRKKAAGHVANRCFEVLRLIFRWAMERRILKHTPFGSIKKPHAEQARDRVFSNDELRRILEALKTEPKQIAALWILLLLTGNRLRETLKIEWAWVDSEDKVLVLPKEVTKSRRQHVVPLVPQATETLDLIQELAGDSPYAFPGPTGDPMNWVQKAGARVMKAAEVDDGRYHDTRRVVDTNLAKLGVGRDVRSLILNHSVGGRLERTYNAYDYLKERRQALTKWARKFEEIIGYKPSDVVRVERKGYQGKSKPRRLDKPNETWADRKARLASEGRDLVQEHRERQARKRTQAKK